MRILGHDVDRANRGGKFAAHEGVALAQGVDLLGEQALQVGFHAVLDEARVHAQVGGVLVLDAVDANEQTVVALGGLHRPELLNVGLQVLTDALRNVLTLSHQ